MMTMMLIKQQVKYLETINKYGTKSYAKAAL
jgi:hypothetical protein